MLCSLERPLHAREACVEVPLGGVVESGETHWTTWLGAKRVSKVSSCHATMEEEGLKTYGCLSVCVQAVK